MRAHLRRCLFVILTAMLLTVTAFADFGPKPQLVVRLENPPDEFYYLDLLEENFAEKLYSINDAISDLDPMYAPLIAAIPEGWHACLAQGTNGAPIWGDLIGKDGIHTFGYHGVPRTYRILIVTKSGQTWVSEPYTRKVLQSSVTVDWPTREVSVPAAWLGYVLQFLSTFVPTILLEGLVLILFRMTSRRNWLRFLLVNLITQGGLALCCSITFVRDGFNSIYLPLFLFMEVVITFVELAIYRRCFSDLSRKRIVLYTISANALSAAAGWFLAEPVWRFVVSIS